METTTSIRTPAAEAGAPPLWTVEEAAPGVDLPILATAIHDGHAVAPETARRFVLPDDVRRREEDPGTDRLADLGVTRVVVHRSRFEVDLNRPRDGAVYADPQAAWGLRVWRDGRPPPAAVALAKREHDEFYAAMERLLAGFERQWGRFAVYDVHSYNHRRNGPEAPPEAAEDNPEINVGTGALGDAGRERWAPVVDRFVSDLRAYDFQGRRLDVRENVRFRGGHFTHWIAERFSGSACPLAIEVKKLYMNEWTGQIGEPYVRELRRALASTLPGVAEALSGPDGPRAKAR